MTAPETGWVEDSLAAEFPGLGLAHVTVPGGRDRSPGPVRERLAKLSDRFGGRQAIVLRQQAIPWAYRVFFRHIGLDPEQTPPPAEEVALNRMRDGRFRSRSRLDDALTIAVAETGVALLALDAERVSGRVGLRPAGDGEPFEGRASPLPPGTILVADEERALAILFGAVARGREVTKRTERSQLLAVGVKGVPDIALEEALWVAESAMLA